MSSYYHWGILEVEISREGKEIGQKKKKKQIICILKLKINVHVLNATSGTIIAGMLIFFLTNLLNILGGRFVSKHHLPL